MSADEFRALAGETGDFLGSVVAGEPAKPTIS